MIKNNRMRPTWGRNVQKWREMEKAVEEGGGRDVLGQEPILARIVTVDNIWLRNINNFIWNYFFHFVPSILTYKFIIFFEEMRTLIFQNIFLNILYPYNFLLIYPVWR